MDLVKQYNGKQLTMIDHDRDTKEGDAFARQYGFFSQPATVIFDRDGKEVHRSYGPSTSKETAELVRRFATGA